MCLRELEPNQLRNLDFHSTTNLNKDKADFLITPNKP